LITLAGLILVLFIIERSCSSPDAKYYELKGQFEGYKTKIEKEKQEWQTTRKTMEAENVRLIAEADKWKEVSGDKVQKIAELDSKLKNLKKEYDSITAENKDAKISNLKDQVFTLTQKYNKAAEGWKAEEQRALNLELIITKKDKIISVIEEQLKNEESLRKLAEDLNKQNEKRFSRLQFGSTVKTILIVGVVAAGGYVLLKEGK
jgi:uncharacterized protein (DUF3084 family)